MKITPAPGSTAHPVPPANLANPANPATAPTPEEQQITEEVRQMFRRSPTDPVNQALCKAVTEFRLEQRP